MTGKRILEGFPALFTVMWFGFGFQLYVILSLEISKVSISGHSRFLETSKNRNMPGPDLGMRLPV